ncbi:MAG: endo-1,4-beta-xylanase [Bacteroidales bacterium]|nr:endo-1,4-beta-xylanase [Bacteroidales bacterium]
MIKKYILPALAACFMWAGCADEFDSRIPEGLVVPTDAEKIAELAEFAPLKQYVNRDANPNFKLGGALTASEFNKKGALYHIAMTNFDEVVAGNAMKMASCVNDKGEMNFSTVSSFVAAAEEAGINVYGHTLAWHSQQANKWLASLIKDKPKPVEPGKEVEKIDYNLDCSTVTRYDWTGAPEQVVTTWNDNGAIHIYNPSPIADWWALQYWLVSGIKLVPEQTYKLKIVYKADGEANIRFKLGDWGGGATANFTTEVTDDFTEKTLTLKPTMESSGLFFQHGDFAGNIWWKSFTITHMEADKPTDVEYKEVWNVENAEFIARDANHTDTPAEVLTGAGPDGQDVIKITGKTNPEQEWDTQFFIYTPEKAWEAGAKYRFTMKYKANKAIGTDTQVHGTPGAYIHWAMLSPNPSFTTEWQEKTWEATIPNEGGGSQKSIAFNLNKNKDSDPGFVYEYYFCDIKWESVSLVEVPKVEHKVAEYVDNGDCEGTNANAFCRKENNGAFEYVITDGVGKGGSRGIQITSNAGAAEDWDTQFWIVLKEALPEGTEFNVSFDYKATAGVSTDTQAHGAPGAYQHWSCAGTVNWTTEWQTYTKTVKVDASMAGANGLGSIAFNLSKDKGQNITFFFDNIRVWREWDEQVKSTIPLTPEEKKDTLTYALTKWINGMMDATEGKVKAWDLVNEAISGGGNIDGRYELQHSEGYKAGENSWDVGGDAFYWQDFLGDVDYVVIAEKAARAAYARQENANPADLKLFINDYNLESTWDDNKKLESLIKWIEVWEAAGAKIDGIGTQMHISYYIDPTSQENQKKHITKMFELMAKSGKLCRVSEFDMGIADKQFGTALKTSEVTPEQEKAMEEYYQWIISEYLRIIPAAQQYGICQWCLTDSPADSGWRGGEPVGLWDLNWNRKYTYRGYVNGLSGNTK